MGVARRDMVSGSQSTSFFEFFLLGVLMHTGTLVFA